MCKKSGEEWGKEKVYERQAIASGKGEGEEVGNVGNGNNECFNRRSAFSSPFNYNF